MRCADTDSPRSCARALAELGEEPESPEANGVLLRTGHARLPQLRGQPGGLPDPTQPRVARGLLEPTTSRPSRRPPFGAILADEQARLNGYVTDGRRPAAWARSCRPARPSRPSPPSRVTGPAPALGQHTDAVVGSLPRHGRPSDGAALRGRGPRRRPLAARGPARCSTWATSWPGRSPPCCWPTSAPMWSRWRPPPGTRCAPSSGSSPPASGASVAWPSTSSRPSRPAGPRGPGRLGRRGPPQPAHAGGPPAGDRLPHHAGHQPRGRVLPHQLVRSAGGAADWPGYDQLFQACAGMGGAGGRRGQRSDVVPVRLHGPPVRHGIDGGHPARRPSTATGPAEGQHVTGSLAGRRRADQRRDLPRRGPARRPRWPRSTTARWGPRRATASTNWPTAGWRCAAR